MNDLIHLTTTVPDLIRVRESIERHACIQERMPVINDYLILYLNARLWAGKPGQQKQERIEFCRYWVEKFQETVKCN